MKAHSGAKTPLHNQRETDGAVVSGHTPGGWLVKDFADGWYWTGDRLNADMAANGGACVFNVETGQYETDAPGAGDRP